MATESSAVNQTERELAPAQSDGAYRPPYRWAVGVGLAVFVLYILTLSPTTAFWDTSEYIATAHIVGIPHPPGNPVFVFLAHTWEMLLFWLPVGTAVKINLFSAANSAVAAAFWFLVAHRVLAFFAEQEIYRRIGAFAAAFLSATAYTVWNQSVVNEKVYTVSLMTIALLTWLAFRWRDNLGGKKDHNLLVLIIFLLALSVGNHLMAFLAAPALAVFVIKVQPRVLARWRLYAFAALAWGLGLSAQLFLPIRAASNPVINEADPTCGSLVDAGADILTFGETNACPALASSLKREQYRKPPLTMNPIFYPRERPRPFSLIKWQFINYFQYFDWQWSRSLDGENYFLAALRLPFTLLFLILGLLGAWRHFERDRSSWVYFAALFATVCVGLVIYLNFKYGYSVPAKITDPTTGRLIDVPRDWREVRERDYFFIVSFSFWGIWAGIGLAALWQSLTESLAEVKGRLVRGDYMRAAPIMLLALLPLALNWKYASRADNYAARDWAYNLLMSVEPYGILFTNGDNDTFPLWYLQEVEGLRQDVTVIVYSYLATPWYARQLRDLTQPCDGKNPYATPTLIVCQRPFEPQKALPIYQGHRWPKPKHSILDLSDAEIEKVPDCYPRDRIGNCAGFQDSVTVPIGDVMGFIPRGGGLVRNDILVLRILQTAAGDRPIYFAGTTGTYEQFALQPFLVRQGVAYKLVNHELQPSDSISPLPAELRGSGRRSQPFWVDVPRTRDLLDNQYIYRNLRDWSFWPDHSTNGIPLQYYQGYYSLMGTYLVRNRADVAEEMYRKALAFAEVALGPISTQIPAPESLPESAAAPTRSLPEGGSAGSVPGSTTSPPDTGP